MRSRRPASQVALAVALALTVLLGSWAVATWPSAARPGVTAAVETGPQPVLFHPSRYRAASASTSVDSIVVLGDSVATGAGCSCRPFDTLFAHQVRQVSGQGVVLSSYPHDGLTSAGLQQQLYDDDGAQRAVSKATTVTVTIGANDFDAAQADSGCSGAGTSCFDNDLAALPGHLRAILSRIHALAGSQVRVLVTGYWNVFLDGQVASQRGRTYTSTSDALTRKVNAAIKSTTEAAGATYVDVYTAFRGDGDQDDTSLLASDGDHPSQAGHQLIAHLLEHALLGR